MAGAAVPTHLPTAELVEREIWTFFKGKGLSPTAIAGIIGNAKQESSLNPSEHNGGLFQYLPSGSRFPGAENHTLTEQLEHAWGEIKGNSGLLSHLQSSKSPQEAAKYFSEEFERPGEPDLSNRENYAHEAYERWFPGAEHSGGFGVLETPIKAGESVVHGAEEGMNALGSIGAFFSKLTEAKTWLRMAEGAGGLVVIYLGVKTLTTGTVATPSVPNVTSVVK